ncbi:MAG: hypothetical protein WBG58_04210, partial [Ignavibacteriaceae bacterium]
MRSKKNLIYTFVVFIISLCLSGSGICQNLDEKVKLIFNIHQERDIYDESDYGEPPQFAIWLEDQEHLT